MSNTVFVGDNLEVRCYEEGESEVEKKKIEFDLNALFSNTYFIILFVFLSIALIIFVIYFIRTIMKQKVSKIN